MAGRPPASPEVCACHHRPVADGAVLCVEGGEEVVALLLRLTPAVARGDREPVTGPDGRIIRGGFGRRPSLPGWDTPSGELSNLVRMLDEQGARMARRTTHARLRSGQTDPPLPLELRAMDDAGRLREVIGRWASIVSGRRVPLDAPWDVAVVAAWLAEQPLRHLRTIGDDGAPPVDAGDLLAELRRVVGRAERAVDLPLARTYLGPCDQLVPVAGSDGQDSGQAVCDGEIVGVESKPLARCTGCGHEVVAADRKRQLLDEAASRWLTAVQIEQLTAALGDRVPANTVATWRGGRAVPGRRGSVRPARIRSQLMAPPGGGEPCWHYPLGDVLAQLAVVQARREQRGRRTA